MIKEELIRTKNELKEEITTLVGKENLNEFKSFAFKDQMIQLAIAVILGAAFQNAVTSISQNLIMPVLTFILSQTGTNWRNIIYSPVDGLTIEIGKFLGTFIDFSLTAMLLYLLYYKVVLPISGGKPVNNTIECRNCLTKINQKCQRCPHCTSWI